MAVTLQSFQPSLLDGAEQPSLRRLGAAVQRIVLGDGAWLDLRQGWVDGADALFDALHGGVPWRAERRVMYDRTVDVPRLLCFYDETESCPTRSWPTLAPPSIGTTGRSWASRSARPGCACTATAATAWPGTATASDGQAPRHDGRHRVARRAARRCCCARAAAVRRTATRSGTATCS